MEKMVFLTNYPDGDLLKDGMMQRVVSIDDKFNGTSRKYIHISFKRHLKASKKYFKDTHILKYNFFLHFLQILKELKGASHIYLHSIYNCLPLMLLSPFIGKTLKASNVILDLHGILPEEMKLSERNFFALLASLTEKWAFKHIDMAIYVTYNMENFFSQKYPAYKKEKLIYNIEPTTLSNDSSAVTVDPLLSKIDIEKNVIVYSGNTQAWQNIPLMLNTIKENLSPYIEYIILTGELDKFNGLIRDHHLKDCGIHLLSLKPEDLHKVYKIANYGFILRDPTPINNVANPTKMIEYLTFGIIPIVIDEHIGDFNRYGYEFIKLSDFSTSIIKRKSVVNPLTATRLIQENRTTNLRDRVLNLPQKTTIYNKNNK